MKRKIIKKFMRMICWSVGCKFDNYTGLEKVFTGICKRCGEKTIERRHFVDEMVNYGIIKK